MSKNGVSHAPRELRDATEIAEEFAKSKKLEECQASVKKTLAALEKSLLEVRLNDYTSRVLVIINTFADMLILKKALTIDQNNSNGHSSWYYAQVENSIRRLEQLLLSDKSPDKFNNSILAMLDAFLQKLNSQTIETERAKTLIAARGAVAAQ